MVPEYEEREAARFAGLTWLEWRAETPEDRANGVAHHRLHMLADAHADNAVASHTKRKAAHR